MIFVAFFYAELTYWGEGRNVFVAFNMGNSWTKINPFINYLLCTCSMSGTLRSKIREEIKFTDFNRFFLILAKTVW